MKGSKTQTASIPIVTRNEYELQLFIRFLSTLISPARQPETDPIQTDTG